MSHTQRRSFRFRPTETPTDRSERSTLPARYRRSPPPDYTATNRSDDPNRPSTSRASREALQEARNIQIVENEFRRPSRLDLPQSARERLPLSRFNDPWYMNNLMDQTEPRDPQPYPTGPDRHLQFYDTSIAMAEQLATEQRISILKGRPGSIMYDERTQTDPNFFKPVNPSNIETVLNFTNRETIHPMVLKKKQERYVPFPKSDSNLPSVEKLKFAKLSKND
jgi:hypothetical protein